MTLYQIGWMPQNLFGENSSIPEFKLQGNIYSNLENARQDAKELQVLHPDRYYIICSDLIR